MSNDPAQSPDTETPERPVDWPLWRRVRLCGGVALACAAIAVAIELLFADIPGGRAVNAYSPRGWSPLWPIVRGLPIGLVAGGVVAGVGLPLYKYRWGGAILGVIVYLALLAGLVFGGRGGLSTTGTESSDAFGVWQAVALFVGFAAISAILATELKPAALGRELEETENTSYWSPF